MHATADRRPTPRWLITMILLAAFALGACTDLEETIEARVTGTGAPQIAYNTIDLAVLDYLDKHDLPGATLAVTKDGRLVWSKGYGWANRHTEIQMEPYHRSRIGSVSKLLVTIATLQLVEDGVIALDDRVYGETDWPAAVQFEDHASWHPPVSEAVLADPEDYWLAMVEGARNLQPEYGPIAPTLFEAASQVTIKHLLSHTSGIPGGGDIDRAEQRFDRDRWSDLTYRHLHLAALMALRDAPEHSRDVKKVLGGIHYVPKEIEMTVSEYLDLLELPRSDPWVEAWLNTLENSGDDATVEIRNPDWTGKRVTLPPFGFTPGIDQTYSNHSFGVAGLIVAEQSGVPYQTYVEREILAPLGVWEAGGKGFAPNYDPLGGMYDAFPHGAGLDPERPDPHDFPSLSGPLALPTGSWSSSAQDMARVMCGLDRSSNHLRLLDRETVTTMEKIAYPGADSSQPLGWDSRRGGATGTELSKNGGITGGRALVMKFLPGHYDDDTEINIAMVINKAASKTASNQQPALLRDIADLVAKADIPDDYDLFEPDYACVVDGPTITIDEPGDGRTSEVGEEILFVATAKDALGNPLPVTWQLQDDVVRESKPSPADGQAYLFSDELPAGRHRIVATTEDSGGHQASDEITVEVTYDPPGVGILTPGDNDTVWEHEDLQVSGWSRMRSHFTLPDDKVAWRITREGDGLVHSAAGHVTTIPGSAMEPGTYRIQFRGSDGVQSAEDEVTVTVEPRPTDLPVVVIHSPDNDSAYMTKGYFNKEDDVIEFSGTAHEANGGSLIDGTRFRWTVTRQGVQQPTVVCEGSRFGAVGSGGGPGPATSCEDFTMEASEFEPTHFAPEGTKYLIVLEVSDRHGNIGKAERTISVGLHPPV